MACFMPCGTSSAGTHGEKGGTWLGWSWEGDGCSRRGCSVSPGCSRGQGGSEGLQRLPQDQFGVAAPARGHADMSQGWKSGGTPPTAHPRGDTDGIEGQHPPHQALERFGGAFQPQRGEVHGTRLPRRVPMVWAEPQDQGGGIRGCSSTGGGYRQCHDGFPPRPQTPLPPSVPGAGTAGPQLWAV